MSERVEAAEKGAKYVLSLRDVRGIIDAAIDSAESLEAEVVTLKAVLRLLDGRYREDWAEGHQDMVDLVLGRVPPKKHHLEPDWSSFTGPNLPPGYEAYAE